MREALAFAGGCRALAALLGRLGARRLWALAASLGFLGGHSLEILIPVSMMHPNHGSHRGPWRNDRAPASVDSRDCRVERHGARRREPLLLARVRAALRGGKESFGLRVVHYSVQGNRVHLIVESSTRGALSRGMAGLGVRMARGVNAALGRAGRVVGERYHARALASPRAVRNALAYVLLNRAKHAGRRLPLAPASSAHVFDGWARGAGGAWSRASRVRPPPLEVASTVVAPRVWLLRVGWRRRGLIDPHAAPAGAAE